jgi:hypothetical protein
MFDLDFEFDIDPTEAPVEDLFGDDSFDHPEFDG